MADPPQKSPSQSHPSSNFFDIELPDLPGESSTFDLEKAVCSHGLFMMAPNKWDPPTKSLLRPLRLSSGTFSAVVRVSQLPHRALLIRVYSTRRLSSADCSAVTVQVTRMLRLSEGEETKVREFQEMHPEARARGFGRVFRSPTLFEDMVKCILFCNCQWPRTLSMAQALCDLQLDLQCHSSREPANTYDDVKLKDIASGCIPSHIAPPTLAVKESKRKRQKVAEVVDGQQLEDLANSYVESSESISSTLMGTAKQLSEDLLTTLVSSNQGEIIDEHSSHFPTKSEDSKADSNCIIGNFPSPEEIAGFDEKYLAKRCGLGYRAGRILKLAQGVLQGNIKLSQLEELCGEASFSNYNKVDEMLNEINGFGPFTRGNVLMCMGFYNVVPTDTETIRHLKQVRSRTVTISTVRKVVEEIYGPYKPYQFLAYWSEIWNFYEDWFGKLSQMQSSDYGLITASNIRAKRKCFSKSM